MSKQSFEVIIVGGGIVGATAACLLGAAGIEVALLDYVAAPLTWPKNTIDNRVSALTLASQNIFQGLDVWNAMLKSGVCPYQQMWVWDAGADGELHFDSADTHNEQLGHIAENRVIVAALWEKLASLSSVSIICPAKVKDVQKLKQGKRVILEQGQQLDAQIILAADGANSSLRSMSGIQVTGWSYQQQGIVATVSCSENHQATARQRFLEQGPLAFLPLYNGQCSIVWTLSEATAREYTKLSDAQFIEQLQSATAGILGEILTVESRAAFPLRFQYANSYISDHLALLGDAAHVMHPLAGQGANAGLLDAAAIAELIITAKQQNRPLGSHRLLRKYERWRKGDNLLMMSSLDVLNKTYKVTKPVLMQIRSKGMNEINQQNWLKNHLNGYAMGIRDDLPKIAQGL